jgi:ABC-2 type transport system ATP-binding protein
MATDTKSAISVRNVSKEFLLPHERKQSVKSVVTNIFKPSGQTERQKALKDISFEVKEGEFFGILGRNGSGKSTLLKLLAGIYKPTNGESLTHGKLVPFIELGVGFNPELTGRENVFLNGAMLGFSRREVEAMYEDIVAFAELERFMDQKLKNYSSGMQVRLAFSMATRSQADILLVDEVLAVGDADFQRKCYDYFKSLKKNNKTVVFVTHDMSAVREYCERAILIQDGVIVHEGKADHIADEYLKLFNTNSGDTSDETGKDSNRWGNGQATISDLDVVVKDDSITLRADITADERGAEDYVFGYRFLDSEGELIMGGNSRNAEDGKRLSLKPHSKQKLIFTMPNILGNGTITVGVTVRLGDKITTCDSWDNAATFSIAKSESYYPVIAPATLKTSES